MSESDEIYSRGETVTSATKADPIREKIEGLFDMLRSTPVEGGSRSSQHLPPLGSRIGDYELVRQLGAGGMGAVFLARQESLDRFVALKVCAYDSKAEAIVRSRFEQEGKSLAKLSHPYVVPVIARGEQSGLLYLVMEYVPGPSLADVIAAVGSAGSSRQASDVVDEILRVGSDAIRRWHRDPAVIDRRFVSWVVDVLNRVVDGLTAIHEAGIVHRDVKPANIVLDTSGKPKIVDFGLARSGSDSGVTQAGEFFGTPAYASPEQLRGDHAAVTARSDLFSLGVTLYESLCLARPFTGQSSADVWNSILSDDPPPLLRTKLKSTPWELEAIADKCLLKSPDARYQSAASLSADLQNYLELKPISAKRATPIRRLARTVRRRPWAAASLLMACILLISGGVAGLQMHHAALERAAAAKRAQYEQLVNTGDGLLFRVLVAERPVWMKSYLDKTRQDAVSAYSSAIELFPNEVWPRFQRGRLFADSIQTADLAKEDFQRAADLRPDFESPRLYLSHLERLSSKSEVDDKQSRDAFNKCSDATDLYWIGSYFALAGHRADIADECLTRSLLIDPSGYWPRLERVLYASDPKTPAHLREKSRASELKLAKSIRPDLPFASEILAMSLDPDYPALARAEMRDLVQRFGMNVLRAFTLSDFAMKEGNFDEAKQVLLQVKDSDHEGGTAEKLADLDRMRGRAEEALRWYEVAIQEKGALSPPASLNIAELYSSLNRQKEAEKAYKDSIRDTADSPEYIQMRSVFYLGYAQWLENQNRLPEAEKILNELKELKFFESRPYAEFAGFLVRRQQTSKAIQVLKFGIELLKGRLPVVERSAATSSDLTRSEIHQLQIQLCRVLQSRGDMAEATRLTNQLENDRPYTGDQARYLIELFNQQERPEDALRIARASEFGDSNDSHDAGVGFVDIQLLTMGRVDERIDRLKMRRALGAVLAPRLYVELSLATPDLREANRILEEAVSHHPDAFFVFVHMALIRQKQGDMKEAENQLNKAVACYVNEASRLAGLKKLSSVLRPMDYISREFDILHAEQFFELCFLAAIQLDKQVVTASIEKRLRDAISKSGGNPEVVLKVKQETIKAVEQFHATKK